MLPQPTNWINEKKDTKSITHTGFVVDNNDPLKIGRVRIRVREFYGETTDISDEDLPWINQKPSSFLGNSSGTTMLVIPEIGTKLNVVFPTSDPNFGYYEGGVNSLDVRNNFFDEDYPNSYGFIDSKNNYVKINKTKNTIEIGHTSGTVITISADGTVIVNSVSNINMTSADTITIQAPNLSISAQQGSVAIESGDVTANGVSLVNHIHHAPHEAGNTSPPL